MRSEDGLLEIGFMRTVFDSLGAGVLVTDTTGRLHRVQPARRTVARAAA